MFSGIIEECATLVALVKEQENVHFTFRCSFVNELKIDQSVSHNGVCLTVVSKTADTYTVTAMYQVDFLQFIEYLVSQADRYLAMFRYHFSIIRLFVFFETFCNER